MRTEKEKTKQHDGKERMHQRILRLLIINSEERRQGTRTMCNEITASSEHVLYVKDDSRGVRKRSFDSSSGTRLPWSPRARSGLCHLQHTIYSRLQQATLEVFDELWFAEFRLKSVECRNSISVSSEPFLIGIFGINGEELSIAIVSINAELRADIQRQTRMQKGAPLYMSSSSSRNPDMSASSILPVSR